MIIRNELTKYLAHLYDYQRFEDYCENGLQVEGKAEIEKIVFGVSFNMPLLQAAVRQKADAVIVHHGIFQSGFFKVKGMFREKIKLLMDNEISLYGIHLPMDGHAELGHNALLLNALGADGLEPFDYGFSGTNKERHSLDKMLEILHCTLHTAGEIFPEQDGNKNAFSLSQRMGFTVLRNGPVIPEKIAVVSGESAGRYESAIDAGTDTFFTGAMKEHTPSVSLESRTNFVNLGHYYSEKPGVTALMERIAAELTVKTAFIEIINPI